MRPRKPIRTLLAAGPLLALVAGGLAACSGQPRAATPPPLDPAAAVEPAEETAADALRRLTEPGDHHQHLDRLAGEWDLTIRVWPAPDAEPLESAGTAEARWILDGRFLWTVYRAGLFGRPFEAWSIDGYDNQAAEYVGTWRDTQGTYTLIYRGQCQRVKPPERVEGEPPPPPPAPDDGFEGAFRKMSSKLTDPVSGEEFKIRTEILVEEDGSGFVLESFIALPDGESLKNLEITGRRPPATG